VRPLPGRLVLLGHPVAHSRSPRFQNAALQAAGIPLVYETMDVAPDALVATLAALRASNAAGNVTIPHKEQVRALCARVTPLAERVGAVNTYWVDDETRALCGDNTDVGGFDELVTSVLGATPANARVLLLGAGGSAAAVIAAAERWSGCRVGLWSRTEDRARALVARFPEIASVEADRDAALTAVDILVNATPLGLRDDAELPAPVERLREDAVVVDLVYRRDGGPTPWVRAARARGLRAADGLAMLIAQGALSFERWFGFAPDREVMWRSVR